MMLPRLAITLGRSATMRGIYSRCRELPVVGSWLHGMAQAVVPEGARVWTKVRSVRGDPFWFLADPRFDTDLIRGQHEPEIQRLLGEVLHAGDCFYDVGAHVGFFCLIAAQIVGPAGRVVAFEPDEVNVAILQKHVSQNALPQISVVKAAIWSSSRLIRFESSNAASSRMEGRVTIGREGESSSRPIRAISLDDFASDRDTARPHLLKIDVEGGESEVLKGAASLIQEARPPVLCEVHDSANDEFLDLWLASNRYRARWIENSEQYPRHLFAEPSEAA